MNERIKELVAQAEDYASEHEEHWHDGPDWQELFSTKFAELIVEECRYVMDCNKGSDQHPEWNRALSETSDKIREHFGVEE